MLPSSQNKTRPYRMMLLIGLLLVLALSAASIGAQEGPDKNGKPVEIPGAVTALESFDKAAAQEDDSFVGAAPFTAAPASGRRAADLREISIIVTLDAPVSSAQLEAVSGGEVIYRYSEVFDGAAMVLSGEAVEKVAAVDGVKRIYLDEARDLYTEVSPEFIGAPSLWKSLGGQEEAGEGVVVGVIDTGIWPEHPSFSDPDPFGSAYPAPPGGPYECDFGNTDTNPDDAPFTCNNKLIGAYNFTAVNQTVNGGLPPGEFDSARDADGHGTHISGTAAGNGDVAASIYGIPRGVVSGVAPRAHVIVYKACVGNCFVSDATAAIEQAIVDGVDVINFSIGGGNRPYDDPSSLAFLSAYENGIFVAAAAGNNGPGPDSTDHQEPWTTTVAASTSDRHFMSKVVLEADNGDFLELEGASVTTGISTPTPVIFPPAGEEYCLAPFAPGTFNGEIVICERGFGPRVAKSFSVGVGGAGGMLLYNPVPLGLDTDSHYVPTVQLEVASGLALQEFMAAHSGVTGTFTQGRATAVQGDVMAAFSSRGGPAQSLGVSKPDITAPGVQILAGQTPLPWNIAFGVPGQLFQSIGGTSMSSPHIAGGGALLKAAHPEWTPGQIKSALMMTAITQGVTKEDGVTLADAFDYGSGRVDLSKAGKASITISETAANFVALEDELWNANLPSLYVPVMPGEIEVQRTIHNETGKKQNWKLKANTPEDVEISVPHRVRVDRNGDATFEIEIDARHVPLGETRFATIEFKLGRERLTFPVTIVRRQPAVTLEKRCDPAEIARKDTTTCTITIENTSFSDAAVAVEDELPRQLKLVRDTVSGADRHRNGVSYEGTLYAAAPPPIHAAVDPLASPYGYLPLGGFPNTFDIGATDDSLANFGVPPFEYAGEIYDTIGIVSNGYVVVGGGTGIDIESVNSDLPDPELPNNVLAPFWTNLNPAVGGRVLLNVIGDGTDIWTVVEWESVRSSTDDETVTTQIWIGSVIDANPAEDISFVYGADVSDGDNGYLTVGAENKVGNSGETVYFNGTGTAPSPSYPLGSYEVDVFSLPGAPGESHVITYDARGDKKGAWLNCAEMESDLFQGVNIACISGVVTK